MTRHGGLARGRLTVPEPAPGRAMVTHRSEAEGVYVPKGPDELVRLGDHARVHGDARLEDVVAEDLEAEGVEGVDRDLDARGLFGDPIDHLFRRLLR